MSFLLAAVCVLQMQMSDCDLLLEWDGVIRPSFRLEEAVKSAVDLTRLGKLSAKSEVVLQCKMFSAYQWLRDFEKADRCLARACELDAEHSDTVWCTGLSALGKKNGESAALESANRLIKKPGSAARGYYLRGESLFGSGRYTEALKALTNAIEADPSFLPPYFTRCQLLLLQNENLELAERDVARIGGIALFGDESIGSSFLIRAGIAAQKREWALVETLLLGADSKFEKDRSFRLCVWFSLAEQRKFSTLKRHVAAELATSPKDPDLLWMNSRVALADGDFVRASELAEQASRTAPDSAEAQVTLGLVHQYRGKERDALLAYSKVVLGERPSPEAYLRLSQLMSTSTDAAIRNGFGAKRLAELAKKHTGQNSSYYAAASLLLSASLLELGMFDAAATELSSVDAEKLNDPTLVAFRKLVANGIETRARLDIRPGQAHSTLYSPLSLYHRLDMSAKRQ